MGAACIRGAGEHSESAPAEAQLDYELHAKRPQAAFVDASASRQTFHLLQLVVFIVAARRF
jgi:hypothetical protein